MRKHHRRCPVCGHDAVQTVGAQIEGRGAMQTVAIVECGKCATLWGEPREFYGVIEADE